MTTAAEYAARIRAARGYAGMNQKELAEALGVHEQTIKQREAGKKQPKRGELLAIAAITGVPVAFMEHGFGEPTGSEVVERLEHIDAVLHDVRDYMGAAVESVGETVSEPRADEADAEGHARTPRRARGRRRAG